MPPFDPARPSVHVQHVVGNYFEALRLPMRDGRPLAPGDQAAAPRAVVVNENFVRRFLPDGRALGRQVILGITDDGTSENTVAWDIVGIVRDVKTGGLADAELLTPEVYVPYAPLPQAVSPQVSFAYVVRTRNPNTAVSPASIREAVRRVDAQAPVSGIMTLDTMIGHSVVNQRFRTLSIMAFALVTLIVAALGVYALRAQAVAARQREVGIRIALGATRRHIRHLIIGRGMRVVAPGPALGLIGAYVARGAIEQWLFGVTITDLTPVVIAIVALGGAALAASWLPARRAARVQPFETLRQD